MKTNVKNLTPAEAQAKLNEYKSKAKLSDYDKSMIALLKVIVKKA